MNLLPTLTVLENVQLPAELGGLAPPDAAATARALLAEVGLEGRERTFPDRLSGGEQQRVAIARALVRGPRLLLADEPTGNLDDATGQSILALLDRVTRRSGRTLVLVTHSSQVAAMADRAFAIEDGHVVALEPSAA
jgi:putative ABC transport system ATP-binding protein